MLVVATMDTILRCHLEEPLTQKGIPFLVLKERADIVEAILCHQPFMVILDFFLSHPSGLTILRQFRAREFSGRVVVLGGSSTQSLVPEATRVGALQIVGRPFNASQALGAVRVAKGTLDDDSELFEANVMRR